MTILSSIVLGAIEGLTEFFPVSSTGHLIVAEKIMGIHDPSLFFNVTIQIGAILAAVIYYRVRIVNILIDAAKKFSWKSTAFYYLAATVPALVVGFIFHNLIESLQTNVGVVAVTTIGIAFYLFWIQQKYKKTAAEGLKEKSIKLWDYVVIGMYQAISVIPGVSRSGITIAGALTRKLSFKEAIDTTFILAIPVMTAATAFEGLKLLKNPSGISLQLLTETAVAFIIAFLVAYISIKVTLPILKKYAFTPFIIYRLLLGALILLLIR